MPILPRKMKQEIMDFIFNNSRIFDRLRSMVHSGYKNEKEVILRNFNKNKPTLDFGCGVGQFSVIFSPEKYYGADTDAKYVDFCKKNRKGNFFMINNVPPYSFKNEQFTQVLISAVVHHIDNETLEAISRELRRILSKNGEIMIIDHFVRKKQKNLLCKFLIDLDRGSFFRNPKEVIEIFSKDFKVKKMKNFKNGPYKDYFLILKKS